MLEASGREIIERAEDLIMRLRDVHSCRISTDETGAITEVHVVASSDRPAKMIARDVETCLMAELGLSLDYRKIGVVLIDAMKDTGLKDRYSSESKDDAEKERIPIEEIAEKVDAIGEGVGAEPLDVPHDIPALVETEAKLEFLEDDVRVRFKGLHLDIEQDKVNAEVMLEKNGLEVTGCLGGVRKGGPLYETIGGATLHALTELLDENFHLCLSAIEMVEIAGRTILVAVVEVVEGRNVNRYCGCVLTGRDPNEAAVLAVLDAMNRPLGRWRACKEIHYTIR
ncbi:MAG: hypothetical protein JSV33_05135 [bacterium]|nr:MAG: hypothetical protein JSV33_05135 [bacterium]